jgi:hypothetical protein
VQAEDVLRCWHRGEGECVSVNSRILQCDRPHMVHNAGPGALCPQVSPGNTSTCSFFGTRRTKADRFQLGPVFRLHFGCRLCPIDDIPGNGRRLAEIVPVQLPGLDLNCQRTSCLDWQTVLEMTAPAHEKTQFEGPIS